MKRPLRPSVVTTAMPALAALVGACSRERPSVNPPPPPPPPPVTPEVHAQRPPEPVRVDPRNLPPIPLAGAPMPVTPLPRPLPQPAPAPAPAPSADLQPRAAPSAMPSLAPAAAPAPAPALLAAAPAPARPQGVPDNAEPGVWIVHNHPPGTPCRPIARAEIEDVARSLPQAPAAAPR